MLRTNRRDRRLRGTSDTLDAENAARAALNDTATAVPRTNDGTVEMLRQIKVAKDVAVEARTSAMITFKAVIVTADPELREQLQSLTKMALIHRCAGLRPGTVDTVTAATRHPARHRPPMATPRRRDQDPRGAARRHARPRPAPAGPTPAPTRCQPTRARRPRAHRRPPLALPGGAPGLPLTAPHLMLRLQKFDIRARPARNTAMLDLAAQLPSVVLSKLLGVHINTATRWTDRAGTPTAPYAAEVARRSEAGESRAP